MPQRLIQGSSRLRRGRRSKRVQALGCMTVRKAKNCLLYRLRGGFLKRAHFQASCMRLLNISRGSVHHEIMCKCTLRRLLTVGPPDEIDTTDLALSRCLEHGQVGHCFEMATASGHSKVCAWLHVGD